MMEEAIKQGDIQDVNYTTDPYIVGECILKWIDAYAKAPGDHRSCWLGNEKKLVCMTWQEVDTSDEE